MSNLQFRSVNCGIFFRFYFHNVIVYNIKIWFVSIFGISIFHQFYMYIYPYYCPLLPIYYAIYCSLLGVYRSIIGSTFICDSDNFASLVNPYIEDCLIQKNLRCQGGNPSFFRLANQLSNFVLLYTNKYIKNPSLANREKIVRSHPF